MLIGRIVKYISAVLGVFIFCLSVANAEEIPKWLTVYDSDNMRIVCDTEALIYGPYMGYVTTGIFQVRTYHIPKTNEKRQAIRNYALYFILDNGYRKDLVNRIETMAEDGTFKIKTDKYYAERVTFFDANSYPVVWFDVTQSVYNKKHVLRKALNNIIIFFEKEKAILNKESKSSR